MNSSAKYQKFEVTREDDLRETKRRVRDSKCLLIGGLVAGILLVSLLLAAALAVGLGVGVSSASVSENEETGLTVITVTEGELEGKYYGSDGSIHFHSTVNDTHFVLTISTTSGELIVTIKHPLVSNMTLMGVNTTNFLIMEDQPDRPDYDDYIVPNDIMDEMESMVMDDKMTDNMLQKLDNTTVNETRETVLSELATSPEAQLIVKAALALGDLGIQGTEYPAVMQFYQLALRLAISAGIGGENNDGNYQDQSYYNNEYTKRGVQHKRGSRCSDGRTCSRCPTGSSCFGQCGYGCSCWSFICGDCCVHQYCLSHDQCCKDEGFFSWACLSVAWRVLGSRCSQNYKCKGLSFSWPRWG